MTKIELVPGSEVFDYQTFSQGKVTIESNIFLIQTEKITLLIDAGSKEIFNVLNHDNIKNIDGILLTHGHADHIKQLNKLQKKYHCPVYLHFNDERLLRNSGLNGSCFVNQKKITAKKCSSTALSKDKTLKFDEFSFQIIEAPGHTNGSVIFYSKELNALFVGDTILGKDIGTRRVPTGDRDKRKKSIQKLQNFLDTLDETTRIYPGHGPVITLYELRKINPYFSKKEEKPEL